MNTDLEIYKKKTDLVTILEEIYFLASAVREQPEVESSGSGCEIWTLMVNRLLAAYIRLCPLGLLRSRPPFPSPPPSGPGLVAALPPRWRWWCCLPYASAAPGAHGPWLFPTAAPVLYNLRPGSGPVPSPSRSYGSTVSPVGISTWDKAKLDQDEHSDSVDIQKETDLVYYSGAVSEQPEVESSGSGVKLENDGPKNGRVPRAVPLGLDEFKSKNINSKTKSGNGEAGGINTEWSLVVLNTIMLQLRREPRDKDKYLRNPCSAEGKFVDIELSEETLVDTIQIANHEHYSSNLKAFELLGSLVYPTDEWVLLGNFTAANNKLAQRFDFQEPKWVRYIKLNLLSHHGSEFYCTLSVIEIYGVDAVERMLEDLISVESSPFVSEGATVDQKPTSSNPDSPEVDEFYHNIVKELEPEYAVGNSDLNNEIMKSEVPDPIKEARHLQVNRMPGDTVLKILMQKVRSLDLVYQFWSDTWRNLIQDMAKIREDIRNLLESQEIIAKDVRNLLSWQSLVSMQLGNLVRDNAILRSEVEKVREKQQSVDNKVFIEQTSPGNFVG
ncbi:unnamed protein product [Prunus armeniaca]|uniref:SUN domain-containing protein n=1 Tax=Prunus armeniaca TaxID=36596 RepID=A0A6J5VLJ3_PRUAR|nr:unnamed protein product [Prunus armeniaca]